MEIQVFCFTRVFSLPEILNVLHLKTNQMYQRKVFQKLVRQIRIRIRCPSPYLGSDGPLCCFVHTKFDDKNLFLWINRRELFTKLRLYKVENGFQFLHIYSHVSICVMHDSFSHHFHVQQNMTTKRGNTKHFFSQQFSANVCYLFSNLF